MQVIDYRTQPVADDLSSIPIQPQTLSLNESFNQIPVHQIINNTLDAINQTFQQIVDKVKTQNAIEQSSPHHSFEDDWNFLYFLRIIFYIIVLIKIFQLVFSKRKKMDLKERVYRKYVFSYAEMIRQFNEQDRKTMDTTLNNTIKNASMDKNLPKLAKKPSNKRVIFHQTKNQYIEPRKNLQNTDGISPLLGTFLSHPVKIEQMQRQVPEEEPSDKDFEIIETISQAKETEQYQKQQFIKKEATQSTLTQSTTTESCIIQDKDEVERGKEHQGKDKQKDL